MHLGTVLECPLKKKIFIFLYIKFQFLDFNVIHILLSRGKHLLPYYIITIKHISANPFCILYLVFHMIFN